MKLETYNKKHFMNRQRLYVKDSNSIGNNPYIVNWEYMKSESLRTNRETISMMKITSMQWKETFSSRVLYRHEHLKSTNNKRKTI